MDIPLLIGVVLCASLIITTKVMEKRSRDKRNEGISRLKPGVMIRTVNGMVGTVTEITPEGNIMADMSPDQAGSVVEITKDAFYKIEK